MRAHILIAEDDANIRLGLMATLESEGYAVVPASDGQQALQLAAQDKFEAIVLDVMMPKASGYDVCRELRARGDRTPVLFLTAKGEEIDKVVGLKLGGDDYVTKPFGVQELLARLEALLRRSRMSRTAAATTDTAPAQFPLGLAIVDRRRFTVTLAGATQPLTARELKLAEILTAHRGEVVTRETLLDQVWGVNYAGTTRTLDQHISQLRKKVTPEGGVDPIATLHGVGYRCDG
jgi:DNA-binding response OmpR family regulator